MPSGDLAAISDTTFGLGGLLLSAQFLQLSSSKQAVRRRGASLVSVSLRRKELGYRSKTDPVLPTGLTFAGSEDIL